MKKDRCPGRGKYIFLYYARACIQRYFAQDVGRESAALAYYLLFSLFPVLIILSTFLSYSQLNEAPVIEWICNILPPEVAVLIGDYLQNLSQMQTAPLSLAAIFLCFWFPMRASNSLITSIRKGLASHPAQGFLRLQLSLFFYAIFLMVTIWFAVMFMVLSNNMLDFLTEILPLPLPIEFVRVWRRFRVIILAILFFLVLYVFYRNGCEKRHPKFSEVCPGIFGAFSAWMLLSHFFSYFVGNITAYSMIYGSIRTIIVLMLWFYLTSTVFIMGAVFNQIMNDTRAKYGSWKPPFPPTEQ